MCFIVTAQMGRVAEWQKRIEYFDTKIGPATDALKIEKCSTIFGAGEAGSIDLNHEQTENPDETPMTCTQYTDRRTDQCVLLCANIVRVAIVGDVELFEKCILFFLSCASHR